MRDLTFSILLSKQAAAGAKSDVQYKYHKLGGLCTCLVKREHVNSYFLVVMMDPQRMWLCFWEDVVEDDHVIRFLE